MVMNGRESWAGNLRKQKQLMVPTIPAWLPWLAEKCETRFLTSPSRWNDWGEHSDGDTPDESGSCWCRRFGDGTWLCRKRLCERPKAMLYGCL